MKKLTSRIAGAAVAIAVAGLCAVAPATAANAYAGTTGKGCTAYVYSQGGYSSCVGYIQRMLNGIEAGYYLGGNDVYLAVDNNFGPATKSQVVKVQRWGYLTADGIVGRNTWDHICFYAGQGAWATSAAGAAKHGAWQAAYDAGCRVTKPAAGGGWVDIQKY